MHVEKLTVAATTDGDGAATVYSDYFTGRVLQIRYAKTNFENTSDFTMTIDGTGDPVLAVTDMTASKTWAPRQDVYDTAGAIAHYDSGDANIKDHIFVAHDRLKIVIAQGGNATTGTFYVLVG